MANREFIRNTNINETNSLVDLMQHMDPTFDEEVNVISHSLYYSDEDFINTTKKVCGHLRILNLNCGGLNAKYDKIKLFLATCNSATSPFSIITLQETHFSSNTDVNMYQLQDYTLVQDVARINSFGGVATYIHNSLSYTRLPIETFNQKSDVYESMLLEVYFNNNKFKKYIIGNIYRRPSELVEDLQTFIAEFTDTLNKINETSKLAYLNGDINIDMLKLNINNHYNLFYENTTAQGFFPKITRPTRCQGDSHTLIDNIFTNNLCKQHTSGILTHHISDHFMNFCILEGNRNHTANKSILIEVESVNYKSIDNFKNSINRANILTNLDNDPMANPNVNYNIFSKALSDCKKKHIPRKLKKFNKRKDKKEKWMTDALLTLVNRKNEMYVDWKSTCDNNEYQIKKTNFKTYEKIVDKSMEEAQNKYYHNTFLAQKSDMKKTWRTINDTLHRNKANEHIQNEFIINDVAISDPKDLANNFNNFFANIGANLSAKIVLDDGCPLFTDYLINPTESRFKLSTITEDDTLSIINKLKSKNSSGNDEISNKLLKAIKHEISKPLTLIINQSLSTGIFPDTLKLAKVKPIYKKGNKSSLNNYRPISLLPTISKVFERVLYTQIYQYFNTNNLLSDQQYGFREKHSTELATIKLIDKIIKDMDNTKTLKTPLTVFLDLSKAFDTLDFDILLYKLRYYGIVGTPLTLIKSYLTNRHQYVNYNNCNSDILEIKTGIPQGSILGPLFFSIYINDIIHSSNIFSFLMYADDTTLYCTLEDFPNNNLVNSINSELNKINIWLKINKLTLNVEKTKSMLFHKRRKVNPIKLSINNSTIDQVPQFCFLGVLLDDTLSWNNHIAMITNKLSKINGILHRLKYIFPKNILLTIYKSLFVPYINFGSLVWGTKIERIETMQKRAIRTITHSHYIAHTEPLLKELQLLNVKDMFSLKILNFLHKLAHNDLPSYFDVYRSHLTKITTPYTLRAHPLPAPPIAHVYAESCLVYQLVQMTNNIRVNYPLILQKIEEKSHSHTGFSNYVKNTMVNNYSYECVKVSCRTCDR